MIDRSID